ncbi:putative ribonuclease H-like domain-containing protein [Tanacetum coccineum]
MVGTMGVPTRDFRHVALRSMAEREVRGCEAAIGLTWNDFKALLVEEFCPSNEIERLENEFWNHKMVGANHAAYTDRFHELAKLVPHLVTPESARIKRYVVRLALEIRGMLKVTQPTTIQDAILRASILTNEAISCGTLSKCNEKRKAVEETSKYRGLLRDKKKAKMGAGFMATAPPKNEFVNQYPKCTKCYTYHPKDGVCKLCFNCQRPGHFAKGFRAPFKRATPMNAVRMGHNRKACYECGSPDHLQVKQKSLMGSLSAKTTSKPKSKDEPDAAVNVHLHRSMIGSLMYLTASRPDIMFAVSAYSRHQVTPLTSNLNATSSDSRDCAGLGCGSHGDRKSTTGGCQFLGRRLISWQCKKQTIVATSSTEAEYVAAANCCGQFWSTASLRAPELGPPTILATIYRTPYTITEDTMRSQLQLGDNGGIEDLPIADIYLGMDNLGYPTEGKLTFHKKKFSPQWSKLFANMRLNFEGDHMPLLAAMLPPAQAAIADEGTREAAPDVPQTIPETIQETRPEPDQSQEHLPTPPRPTTSDRIPPVFEQGHTSDPNIASFSGAHESDPDLFTSTNVEDETLGGSFHTTPPRSTQVPPVGPTSGGAEDLATLTALSSLVSELVQKVSTLESELQAHKLLFKDVVGKLVKKVKALELKLNTRSRKVVMSESDKEEEEEQDVDPLIKLAKAAAASDAHVDVSPGADIPPSPPLPTGMSAGVSSGAPTGPSTVSPGSTTVPTSRSVPAAETIPASSGTTPETPSSPVRDARKGKGVAVEEPTPTHDKTFKQLEEERLGWEAAQRLQAQELTNFEK